VIRGDTPETLGASRLSTDRYVAYLRLSTRELQRNVAVLLRRVLIALVIQILECRNEFFTSFARPDDLVDESRAGGDIRICEFFTKLLYLLFSSGARIVRRGEFPLVENIDGALGTHHRDLGAWPRVIEVRPNVLARH